MAKMVKAKGHAKVIVTGRRRRFRPPTTHSRKKGLYPGRNRFLHATGSDAAGPITNGGFLRSKDGRLGAGVYFTKNLKVATILAKQRDPARGQIFLVTVNMGKQKNYSPTKRVNPIAHQRGQNDWHGSFDSATDMHSPWPRPEITFPHREWCVDNPTRISLCAKFSWQRAEQERHKKQIKEWMAGGRRVPAGGQ